MRASQAIKLTVQQRLGFEITLARSRIERGYAKVQREIHDGHKVNESTMIELHEAEQILAALERVSGDFYRRHLADMKAYREDMKAYREEQKQRAKEDADSAVAFASRNGDNDDVR